MGFREIEVEDGEWARPLLEAGGYRSCEFAFVNLFIWSRVYHTKIARYKDFVIARSEGRRLHYLYPAGRGDVEEALEAILQDARQDGRAPVLFSLTRRARDRLAASFPGQFRISKPRGEADYIYLSSDLAGLPGKPFQKKRNHCSRFERENAGLWEFLEITPQNLEEVCAFNDRWAGGRGGRGDGAIEAEHRAVGRALRHYGGLGLRGGCLTVEGEIVAFSFGSPLGPDMFVTHVEKARHDVPGAYNMVNREMARALCARYRFINRENDVDAEGLRAAKLSYHPVMLEEKYTAELILD